MRPLTFVVGTRPEAIKVGPVVAACKSHGIPHCVLHTGQHTDLLLGTGLEPDAHLGSYRPDHDPWVTADRSADALGKTEPAELVVVQGDTISAYAGMLWAQAE